MAAIRRTALAAVTLVLMSSLPQQVAAKGGELPLRTWCNSPTMEYCVSLLSWEYTFSANDSYPEEGDLSFSAVLRGSGSALSQGRGFVLEEFRFAFESARGWEWELFEEDPLFSEPGQVITVHDVDYVATPVREVKWEDFAYIAFGDVGDACVTSKKWPRRLGFGAGAPVCYRVPEPSTWLLLGTGLLGLGFVAWRRKEEDQAA